MKRKKAVFATVVIGCMTLAIMVGMLLLKYMIPFYITLGAFGVVGFFSVVTTLAGWLSDDKEVQDVLTPVKTAEIDRGRDEYFGYVDASVDDVIEEVKSSI